MKEKLMLWPFAVEGDFQPFLEMSLLDRPRAAKSGLVLVLPGGGYLMRADHEGAPVAEKFNELGWHAATLQYRVSPSVFPAPQQDAVRALRLIRGRSAECGVDRIAILGFSAGAHLAACTGTIWNEINADAGDATDRENGRPDAMILCYPVIYLTHGHLGSAQNLFGAEHPATDELAPLDLDKLVTAETPPAFLWATAADEAVPVRCSMEYAGALDGFGIPFEIHVWPTGHHGLCLGDQVTEARPYGDRHPSSDWMEAAVRFMYWGAK